MSRDIVPNSQILTIITTQFPDLKFDGVVGEQKEIEDSEKMTAYALLLLDDHKYDKVRKFFSVVDELYCRCEKTMATAIGKVLISRIGTRMKVDNDRWDILALFPESFKELMRKELICT